MKKQILTIIIALSALSGISQTATDFTANDCSGNSYNLFTELNAGKVVVLCWVMPCGACVGPALTSYNMVQSYQSANPNTVYLYLVDDYANTTCASLGSWANSNNIPASSTSLRFSNAAIDMNDYGSTGMPKIVVVGGPNHAVFYNVNNTVNATNLENAINAALSATGIGEAGSTVSTFQALPNPSTSTSEISFLLTKSSVVTLDLFNLEGQKVKTAFSGSLSAGEHKVTVDVSGYASGIYLVRLSDGDKNTFINLAVSH